MRATAAGTTVAEELAGVLNLLRLGGTTGRVRVPIRPVVDGTFNATAAVQARIVDKVLATAVIVRTGMTAVIVAIAAIATAVRSGGTLVILEGRKGAAKVENTTLHHQEDGVKVAIAPGQDETETVSCFYSTNARKARAVSTGTLQRQSAGS